MHSRSLLLVLLVVLVGGAAGALAAHLAGPADSSDVTFAIEGADSSSSELLVELREIREAQQGLLARLVALEQRPPAVTTSSFDQEKTRQQIEALTLEVNRLSERAPRADEGEPVILGGDGEKVLVEKLAKKLEETQRSASAKGWRQGSEKRQAAIEDRLAKLQSDLGLNANQVDDLRTAFTEQHDREMEMIRRWEAGEPVGEMKGENHRTHQAALQRIFTPTQLEQFRARQRERGGK